MPNPTIDTLQLREWIYDRLKRGPFANSELELAEVAREVYGKVHPTQPIRPMGAHGNFHFTSRTRIVASSGN